MRTMACSSLRFFALCTVMQTAQRAGDLKDSDAFLLELTG